MRSLQPVGTAKEHGVTLLCFPQFTHRLPFLEVSIVKPCSLCYAEYEAGSVFTQRKWLLYFKFTFLCKGWYQCSWRAQGRQWISSNWNLAIRAEYFLGSILPTCDRDAHRTHAVSNGITWSNTAIANSQWFATVGTKKASRHRQVPHMFQYQKLAKRSKQEKGKVHPCSGTETLYRPYGLQGE